MSYKLMVYKNGRADVDRFERGTTVEELGKQLDQMEGGDCVLLFVNNEGQDKPNFVGLARFTIEPRPPGLYEALYEHLRQKLPSLLSQKDLDSIDEGLVEIVHQYDCQ